MKKTKGFTLIELLIVIAIIGILVGIALPSYQAHVRKGNRIDVQLAMTKLSVSVEREYARQGDYPNAIASETVGSYLLTYQKMFVGTGTGFWIVATPQGSQVSDECGRMRITQSGEKNADLPTCW